MNYATLDPPGQPGETIMWCPLCGNVISRRSPGDLRPPLAVAILEEAYATDHMRDAHHLTAEDAVKVLSEVMSR